VLFLFVVMLLNAPREDVPSPYGPAYVTLTTGPRKAFAILSLVLLIQLAFIVGYYVVAAPPSGPDRAAHVSSVHEIGISIFTDYSVAFEATSVLIVVAMIGAVVLAKKKL
jgi:NADH-quinone oxidoreductase subunit J